ncbi:MAG TPA: Trk system potassium transporter TrkA [Firmicutes bacterium]|nr:Trk system potassium transporter TrkA [Bacillota bacterium]
MQVIVIGAGDVGYEIASRLSRDNHDVVVIERDPDRAERVNNNLDVLVVQGNGASARVLEEAGIKKAELLIAVTGLDEYNIVACMLAKRYGVEITVARIRNQEYGAKTSVLSNEDLGIDLVIQPERVAAMEIVRLLKNPAATDVDFFAQRKVQMLGFRVDAEAPIVGKKLSQLSLNVLIGAIARNGDVIIPGGDDIILANDTVFVIGKTGSMSEMGFLTGKSSERIRRVMIVGGGNIGYHVADMLQRYKDLGITVKLIEKREERCRELAEQLQDVLILKGSGTDLELLKEEGIEEIDAFVAVTGNDEVNIVSGLVAKHLGVRKVIVEVNQPTYAPVVDTLGLDQAVHPRLVTAGTILSLLRRKSVFSVSILKDDKVEVMELAIQPGFRAANKKLRSLKLPRGVLIGSICRGKEVIIPRGDDVLQPGDRVVIFARPEVAETVAQYFKPKA